MNNKQQKSSVPHYFSQSAENAETEKLQPLGTESTATETITLVAYPKIIMSWPLVIFPFALIAIQTTFAGVLPAIPIELISITYFTLMLLILLGLGADFSRVESLCFLCVVFSTLIAVSYFFSLSTEPQFFSFFLPSAPYPKDFALELSFWLGCILLAACTWSHLFHSFIIDEKKGVRARFFTSRQGNHSLDELTVRVIIPDYLEYFLTGCGTLQLEHDKGELTLNHVPMPVKKRRRIASILQRVQKK